jgi:hypothetical protein
VPSHSSTGYRRKERAAEFVRDPVQNGRTQEIFHIGRSSNCGILVSNLVLTITVQEDRDHFAQFREWIRASITGIFHAENNVDLRTSFFPPRAFRLRARLERCWVEQLRTVRPSGTLCGMRPGVSMRIMLGQCLYSIRILISRDSKERTGPAPIADSPCQCSLEFQSTSWHVPSSLAEETNVVAGGGGVHAQCHGTSCFRSTTGLNWNPMLQSGADFPDDWCPTTTAGASERFYRRTVGK